MDTKQIIEYKKQIIQEELQKVIPPGFVLVLWSQVKSEHQPQVNIFLDKDVDFIMKVGYLLPTEPNKQKIFDLLVFNGIKLKRYKEVLNSERVSNDSGLRKNIEELCDYLIRFYDLAEIIIKRAEDEVERQISYKHSQQQQQQNATKFVAGATKFRPGETVSIKSAKVSGIIPKTKAIPQKLLDTISTSTAAEEDKIGAPRKVVSSLGRLTLDLVQVSDNLDVIREVIQEDYKNTRATNKKELEEYKKRVANRGRILGKRDLGDNKTDLKGLIKKYVGGFFSGTGGSIRGLAMFNLLQGLLSGDPSKIIGPLLGIGATYLPAIGMGLGGIIAKRLLSGLFGGGVRAAAGGGRLGASSAVGGMGRIGRFGKYAALATAGLSLASAFSNRQEDTQGQRLEDLTQEQKAAVDPKNIVPLPQDDLKRFEELNKKFETALDFLMGKQKDQGKGAPTGSSGNPSPSPTQTGELGVLSGEMLASNVEASYYNPSLGGINASGAKTAEGLPATSTGEGYKANVFSAAAFPSLLSKLPQSMTTANGSMPGGRTLASGQAFNLMVVDPKTGKQAIVRVNDVGPGVAGQSSNRMLDLSVAAKDYFGQNAKGLQIYLADQTSRPGALRTTGTVPSAPVLLPSTQPAPRREYQNITITPPSPAPSVVVTPISQSQPSSPTSSNSGGNSIVPAFETSYSENFLTMYSKLIYQIV